MVSDLVGPEQRPDAFALMRMSDNVGIAIGPAIGGFIAVSSYTTGFTITAISLLLYSLAIALFTQENIPTSSATARSAAPLLGGVLNDQIGPKAIWLGSSLFGILGSLGFAAMSRRQESLKSTAADETQVA